LVYKELPVVYGVAIERTKWYLLLYWFLLFMQLVVLLVKLVAKDTIVSWWSEVWVYHSMVDFQKRDALLE